MTDPDALLDRYFTLAGVRRACIERSAALRERVRLAGTLPFDRMAAFYSAADLLVVYGFFFSCSFG